MYREHEVANACNHLFCMTGLALTKDGRHVNQFLNEEDLCFMATSLWFYHPNEACRRFTLNPFQCNAKWCLVLSRSPS